MAERFLRCPVPCPGQRQVALHPAGGVRLLSRRVDRKRRRSRVEGHCTAVCQRCGARGCRQDPQPRPDHPGGGQCPGGPLHADHDVRRRRQGVLRRVARRHGTRGRRRGLQRQPGNSEDHGDRRPGLWRSARPAWTPRSFTRTSWSRPSSPSTGNTGSYEGVWGQNLHLGRVVLKVWAGHPALSYGPLASGRPKVGVCPRCGWPPSHLSRRAPRVPRLRAPAAAVVLSLCWPPRRPEGCEYSYDDGRGELPVDTSCGDRRGDAAGSAVETCPYRRRARRVGARRSCRTPRGRFSHRLRDCRRGRGNETESTGQLPSGTYALTLACRSERRVSFTVRDAEFALVDLSLRCGTSRVNVVHLSKDSVLRMTVEASYGRQLRRSTENDAGI